MRKSSRQTRRPHQRPNRRQMLWSLLLLIAGFAILWWQQQHSTHVLRQSVADSLTSDTLFVAERFPGSYAIHLMMGIPTDTTPHDDVLLQRPQYTLSYNPTTRCPNWVSWNQSAWWYGSAPRHRGPFLPDPLLPRQYTPVYHRDYTNSGYDRGHLVRSEERTRTEEDNRTTFYTTNIVPQHRALNIGPWLRLEEYVERLCKEGKRELYIIAGPIFHDTFHTTIGNGIRVPAECFKIIVILPKGRGRESVTTATEVIAVRMPNRMDVRGSWEQFTTTIEEIERATGYRFLTAIPDSIARVLKARRPTAIAF